MAHRRGENIQNTLILGHIGVYFFSTFLIDAGKVIKYLAGIMTDTPESDKNGTLATVQVPIKDAELLSAIDEVSEAHGQAGRAAVARMALRQFVREELQRLETTGK